MSFIYWSAPILGRSNVASSSVLDGQRPARFLQLFAVSLETSALLGIVLIRVIRG